MLKTFPMVRVDTPSTTSYHNCRSETLGHEDTTLDRSSEWSTRYLPFSESKKHGVKGVNSLPLFSHMNKDTVDSVFFPHTDRVSHRYSLTKPDKINTISERILFFPSSHHSLPPSVTSFLRHYVSPFLP